MVDIARLEGGSSFGELALIDGKPRFSTIKCTERTHFLTIHREDYEKAKEKIKLAKRDEKVNFMKQ
jgi:CRP-like cAMP-binding protein